MRITWPLLALLVALACAAPRSGNAPPAATVKAAAPAPSAAPIAPPVARGMDASQLRRALGEPMRVERVDSAVAKGARYERWIYADREVVLLDGKVVDVVP